MKTKGCKVLSFTQRQQLETLSNARKHSVKEMAEFLGVSLSTVYLELQRGAYMKKYVTQDYWRDCTTHYRKCYSAQIAHDNYKLNMTSKGAPLKIGKDFALLAYIEKRVLKDKISPCAVLGEIKQKKMSFDTQISKTTLYRYIHIGMFETLSDKHLKMNKKKPKKKQGKVGPKGVSIEKRPAEINARKTFGHWEMDCVCGPTRPCLLVLTERLTRQEILMLMPNQKSNSVVRCLNVLERRFGKSFKSVFKSITVDNGSEFSDLKGMQTSSFGKSTKRRVDFYYCHPYTACERGTNERLNREIRRLVPKGSDLSKLSEKDVSIVENWLNNYPRQVLGYRTSQEVFDEYLSQVA